MRRGKGRGEGSGACVEFCWQERVGAWTCGCGGILWANGPMEQGLPRTCVLMSNEVENTQDA